MIPVRCRPSQPPANGTPRASAGLSRTHSMTRCHWLALLAGAVFCAAAAAQPSSPRDARMPAQASSSHAPIRSSVDPQQLRLFLQQRLGMTDDPDALEKLLQDPDL